MIVYISLVAALFCAVPLVLINFEVNERITWAISSGLMGINISIFIFYVWRNTRLVALHPVSRIIYIAFFLAAVILVAMNTLNALGIIFNREYGPYFLSYVFCLFLVGFNFARLLLRPLWKAVKKLETEDKELSGNKVCGTDANIQ
jgi:hypothetical protein